jgi:hypothetical protein
LAQLRSAFLFIIGVVAVTAVIYLVWCLFDGLNPAFGTAKSSVYSPPSAMVGQADELRRGKIFIIAILVTAWFIYSLWSSRPLTPKQAEAKEVKRLALLADAADLAERQRKDREREAAGALIAEEGRAVARVTAETHSGWIREIVTVTRRDVARESP